MIFSRQPCKRHYVPVPLAARCHLQSSPMAGPLSNGTRWGRGDKTLETHILAMASRGSPKAPHSSAGGVTIIHNHPRYAPGRALGGGGAETHPFANYKVLLKYKASSFHLEICLQHSLTFRLACQNLGNSLLSISPSFECCAEIVAQLRIIQSKRYLPRVGNDSASTPTARLLRASHQAPIWVHRLSMEPHHSS